MPSAEDRHHFCKILHSELEPWGSRLGISLRVTSVEQPAISPWCVLAIDAGRSLARDAVNDSDWIGLLRIADEAAASELILRSGKKRLLVGKLSQKRYWSDTQARLLAQRVVWGHLDAFKGRK